MGTPYPSEWVSDVVLADGGTVHLRPIRADDDGALLGLYSRLSDESLYLRFFSPVPAATAQQLERLAGIDYTDRFALVAELGDELIAVGRFDRLPSGDAAEVAFVVADDQQGRGIASILLEHLAAVARGVGVRRFVASTLAENRKMLRVFFDAGFEVKRSYDEGTVELSFPIAPTDASVAAVDAREHVAESRSIERLLTPTSIAVIGAGRRPRTIGHEVLRNLVSGEFEGPVYPVNPNARHLASLRAYPTILDVPDQVDLAVIVVPAAEVPETVRQCAEKGVHGLVVISAGFAEVGDTQARTEHELVELARRHGMRLVGPNCMGAVNTNPSVRMNATFAPVRPRAGRVAFSSQSGALGIELLAQADALGLGVSTFVSLGNKADVSSNDLLQYWEDDPDTDVILLYLESFGNPRKFARIARRISRHKPIVAVKSGRTTAGARGALSHTAALASPDVAVDALFRQAGVIRVDTLEQLFDTAAVVAHQPLPAGRRVAIVSNGGGPAILAADACVGAGLEVPELSEATQAELRAFAPHDAGLRNPVDLVASATAEVYERALRTIIADDGVDAVIAIFVPPLVTRTEDVARAIAAAAADAGDVPVVSCFLGRRGVPDAPDDSGGARGAGEHVPASAGAARRIPSFAFPEAAAAALAHAADHADWLSRPTGAVPTFEGVDVDRARGLVEARLVANPSGEWLSWPVARDLCACFGVTLATTAVVDDADDAVVVATSLGYPVALKVAAATVVHKTDVGGVRLGLADETAVRDAFTAMRSELGASFSGALVQPMAPAGVETLVGVTHDRSFGPLVLFGMGGVDAELVRDTSLRILPLTDVDAAELVRSLRSSPRLFGYRGTPATDTAALEELLLRVAQLADALPEVAELDLNPVVVSPAGVSLVDVKIRLAPAPSGPPPGVRRMRG